MTQIAFATYRNSPEMVADDRLAADILRSDGISVVSAVWDDPNIDWSRFGRVVIRSTWDYHYHPERYAEWLRRASAATTLWNPAEAILANINKRYLAELANRGVETTPTEHLSIGDTRRLRDVLTARGWREAIIKPAVSASAHKTWRASLTTADADQTEFAEQLRSHDILVQPFIEEIASRGEWSLMFFGGRYSHAVLKRPAAGDFRVQEHCGGESAVGDPPPELIRQAQNILAKVESPLLYARVDGVDLGGRFLLMELEINEPSLFLGFSPEAPSRFAEAIKAVL